MAVSMSDANTSMHAGLVSPLPQNSTQLPQEFVEADQKHLSNAELESTEDPELDFPVLDLSLLSGDKKHHDEVITAAAEACQNWGFFQIQNHGIDQRLIEKCKEEALRMFQLPLEAKKRCDRPPGTSFGYGSNTWVNQKVQHWAESFHLQLKPMSNVPAMASKLFPDQTSSQQFRSTLKPCLRLSNPSRFNKSFNTDVCAAQPLKNTWRQCRIWQFKWWRFSPRGWVCLQPTSASIFKEREWYLCGSTSTPLALSLPRQSASELTPTPI